MIKRMILMLLLTGAVLGGLFAYKMYGMKMMMAGMAAGANPSQTVSTTKAASLDWQAELRAVGTLRAVMGSDISPEVSGLVETLPFTSGADIEKDAVLLKINADDDIAKLKSLEAAAKLAQITFERDEKQLKAQAISQATLDTDKAALDSANAQVDEQKANVDKKTLRAPFAGRLGLRLVDVGQYLSPGTAVVTLQQIAPIYLDFYMPQQAMPQLQVGQKVAVKTDAYPDKNFEGEISAVNAKVNEDTRNIMVRASLKNEDKLLLPGMFATIIIASGGPEKHITLPQTAVTFNPYGNVVYLVKPKGPNDKGDSDKIAKTVFVKTGETRGDQIMILDGIAEGDEVVTSGQVKLRNGSPVIVSNDVQPSNDAAPVPQDGGKN